MLLFVCFPSFFHHHLSSMSVLSNRIAITGCCADGGAPWRARENESWPTFWQWRQKSEELSCASLIFSSVIFFFSSSYPSVSDISLVSSRSPPTGSPLFFRVSRVSASLTWPQCSYISTEFWGTVHTPTVSLSLSRPCVWWSVYFPPEIISATVLMFSLEHQHSHAVDHLTCWSKAVV